MDPVIKKILKTNHVDGVFHTHVSLIKPKGKFQFNRQTLEEFWEGYCKQIKDDPDVVMGIAEKPQQYIAVIADIDLKIRDESDDPIQTNSLYTDEQLEEVIRIYQSVLNQIVDKITPQELTCVVLEKAMYSTTKNDITYLKHGFHLHFPYIFMNKVDQDIQLIPRVKEAVKEKNLFKNLGIEDSGSVIDKECCSVPWLLYGSRKSEDKDPYIATRIYDHDMKNISLERAFKGYQIYNNKEQLIHIKGNVEYYLPRILSINPWGRQTKEIKRGVVSPVKEKLRKTRKTSTKNAYDEMSLEKTLETAKRLLPMLADFRADDRNEWLTVGWCLYSITDGHPDGLELWCEFSSRCDDKYEESGCIYQWERMTKRDLTIGTLKYFAKVDNPIEYQKYKNEQTDKYIESSLDGSHNDIAKALYAEYGDEFVCASVSLKRWFRFSGGKWEEVEGVFLRRKISELSSKYTEMAKKLYDQLRDADKAKSTMIEEKLKRLNKLIGNLKQSPFKNNVMTECMEVFYDHRFKEKLDVDPYIISFKNGVYDLRNNIFRPGRPEDFLSMSMPIDYVEFTEDDNKVHEIHTFLEHVFPDKSIRKYFLDLSSDIFVGGNHEKIVPFWTGEGDNGKSVTQKFFELMLGKLAIKMNTNVITSNKPSAGSAFADLARAGGGVRWAVFEEPNADEAINSGIFKHLSGNDSFYARDLFEKGKDGREITPLFKLAFICNKLPRFKGADKAVFNRVRVLPFEATFCKPENPAPETLEEQIRQKRFPMDTTFAKKIPGLVEAFCWVLLQHRIKIANEPRIEPEKVRIATEYYKKQNDIYRQFIDERIVADPTKSLSLTELYNMFKEWFRESLPGLTLPLKIDVEECFSKIWGSPQGKKWQGYRQKTLQDVIANGDVIVLSPEDLEKDD